MSSPNPPQITTIPAVPVSLGMADAAEDAAWLALEEIAVTVMRGKPQTVATGPLPVGAANTGTVATGPLPAGAEASLNGRERVWKVLMVATDYFEKNPSRKHDDIRQLVRNVRPRVEPSPCAEPPPSNPVGGLFGGAFPCSGGGPGGGGLFGTPASGGGVFTMPADGKEFVFGGSPPKKSVGVGCEVRRQPAEVGRDGW